MSRKLRAVTVLGEKMTQRWMKSGKSDENQKSCDTNRAKSDTALFFDGRGFAAGVVHEKGRFCGQDGVGARAVQVYFII
jgi:hypothetical protein